jgi:hypothetical protein
LASIGYFNYLIRLYQARPEVLNGSWTFLNITATDGATPTCYSMRLRVAGLCRPRG